MLLGPHKALFIGQYVTYNVDNPNFPTLYLRSDTIYFLLDEAAFCYSYIYTLQLCNPEISLCWKHVKFRGLYMRQGPYSNTVMQNEYISVNRKMTFNRK